MVLYRIRPEINIFDLCIFWRFLEVFIGKRKTPVEISIAVLLVYKATGNIINLKGIDISFTGYSWKK